MKTDGEKLYDMYAEVQLELNNCGVEDWLDMEQQEQQVWEKLAKMVRW